MLMQAGWFALGAVLLLLGADSLLRGAAGMALALRVRPFLVGLVVLGLGTSLPELAVNLAAMRAGHAGIALGNAVGSSIANFGLVLGVAALVAPFAVGLRLGVVLLPLVVACTVILGLLGGDSVLTRFDAAVLLALGGVALVLVLARAGRESADVQRVFAAAAASRPGTGLALFRIAVGVALLGFGSLHAVHAATQLAGIWGWSDLRVGLTLVAPGTLLPELLTAALAARRGHGDLALGNVIGGSVANLTLVLGASALWGPIAVPRQLVEVELPALALLALALYPMLRGDAQLSRREGAILLLAYLAFFLWQAWLAAA